MAHQTNGHHGSAMGDDGTASARERLEGHLSDAHERATEVAEDLSRTAKASVDEGTRFVRENPGIALAGALGLGVLIGLSLRGRG